MISFIRFSAVIVISLFCIASRPCSSEVIDRAGKVVLHPIETSQHDMKPYQQYEIVEAVDPATNKTEFSMLNIKTRKKTKFPDNVKPVNPQCVVYGEPPTDVGLTMVGIDDIPDYKAPHKLRAGIFDAKTGSLVTLPENFEDMSWFSCGRAAFSILAPDAEHHAKRKWGFLDERGQIAVRPIYEEASAFTENLAPVVENGQWVFIDKTGKTAIDLPPDCHRARFFSDGLAPIVCGPSPTQPSGYPGKDNRLGFIDKTGKMVISPQFSGKFDNPGFYNGLAAVVQADPRHLMGYIDKTGQWVIPPQFDSAAPFSDDGTATVHFGVVQFDKKQWDSELGRYPQFLAFLVKPGLLNLTREEVHGTFGSSNSSQKNDEETYIVESSHSGTSTFTVHFENNKVTRFKMNFMSQNEWVDSEHPLQLDY